MVQVINMMTAAIILAIIIISGASRLYIKKRFDVSGHIQEVERASKRNDNVQAHSKTF